MKIALCNGGLGNQTFQYVFSRFVELEGGGPCFLDDAAFYGEAPQHNGFEITKVFPHAKPRLLSEALSEDVWKYVAEQGNVAQQMRNAGEELTLVAETSDYRFDGTVIPVPVNGFLPWLARAKGNVYYHGYWINPKWLKGKYKETLLRELEFAPLEDDRNKRYAEEIQSTTSVSLHVRRGDFVSLHMDAPTENYRVAVNVMREQLEAVHFFLFSDDMDWCRANREEMGLREEEVTFVEGNDRDGRNYLDMQLMTYCKGMILANTSSFSYLAALLNQNEGVAIFNMTKRET